MLNNFIVNVLLGWGFGVFFWFWGFFFSFSFFKDKTEGVDFGFHLCVKYNNLSSFRNYISSAPQDKKRSRFGLSELKYLQSMSPGKQSHKHLPQRGSKT